MSNKPEWLEAMEARLEQLNGNRAALARELNYSRTAVSLVLDGKYRGGVENIKRAVEENLMNHKRYCVAVDADVSAQKCADYLSRPMPTSSPEALRAWQRCQGCTHNPNREGGNNA